MLKIRGNYPHPRSACPAAMETNPVPRLPLYLCTTEANSDRDHCAGQCLDAKRPWTCWQGFPADPGEKIGKK